jgi:hypothetical protein
MKVASTGTHENGDQQRSIFRSQWVTSSYLPPRSRVSFSGPIILMGLRPWVFLRSSSPSIRNAHPRVVMFLMANKTARGGGSRCRWLIMIENRSTPWGHSSSHRQQLAQVQAPPSSPLARYEQMERRSIFRHRHTSRHAPHWGQRFVGISSFVIPILTHQ